MISQGLQLSQIRKRIGDFELRAEFEVAPSERVALLGRSGSGKTTLLRMIAGLEPLDSGTEAGRILLNGQDLAPLPPEKRKIGLVFQDQALFPSLDVLDNLTSALRMQGMPRRQREAEALPWAEKTGLTPLLRPPIQRLSGGERQRVAFVRALLWKPALILLDEPFSALDTELRSVLRRELLELHQLWPVPLLLVTHDQADVDALATRSIRYEEQQGGRLRYFRG